jgi:Tol biopolymer transport system component
VGYWSQDDQHLKKIVVTGGAPVTLCLASNPFGAVWGPDGNIVFGQETGIMRVSENGGNMEPLVEIKEDEFIHGIQILPGGKWILFSITNTRGFDRWDKAQIVVQSLESGERKLLVPGGSDARYASTGHLVYAMGNNLYAAAFDVDNLEVEEGSIPIVEGIARATGLSSNTGSAHYDFSNTGMLAYVAGSQAEPALGLYEPRSLVWVSREGEEETISIPYNPFYEVMISPEGTKVAVPTSDSFGNYDIYVWDFVREIKSKLTFDEAIDGDPVWSPDGTKIAFTSDRAGRYGIYEKAADGTGEAELLLSMPDRTHYAASWSSDGKTLFLVEHSTDTGYDIAALSLDGEPVRKPVLQGRHNEIHPQISPDGRWIAYASDESGQYAVYVRPYPEVNTGKWQISAGGGSPLWAPDGRELFYRSDKAIMAVSVKSEPTFVMEKPRTIFKGEYDSFDSNVVGAIYFRCWHISPDGKRFLMIKPVESYIDASTGQVSSPKINIVLNWFEELKEKVPVD